MPTGDILIRSPSGQFVSVPSGATGNVLTSPGPGLMPGYAAGGGGSGTPYMPVTLGDDPPTFLTDGAGRLLMVPFTP